MATYLHVPGVGAYVDGGEELHVPGVGAYDGIDPPAGGRRRAGIISGWLLPILLLLASPALGQMTISDMELAQAKNAIADGTVDE